MLSQPSRPRRRLRVLWPILISVVVIGVVVIVSSGSRSPVETLYVEDLRDLGVEAKRSATAFQAVLEDITSIDRVELTSAIDQIQDSLQAVLDDEPPTEGGVEARALWSLMDSSVTSWLEGVTAFESSLLRAADEPNVLAAEDALTGAFARLESGDRLYLAFLGVAQDPDFPQPVSGYPDVSFLPDGLPLAATVDTLVAFARAPGSPLPLRARVAIDQVTTSPEWIETLDEELVVEATELLDVAVVVANVGNADSAGSEVFFDLASLGEPVATESAVVPVLKPGERTTITFEAVEVTPGSPYELLVRLGTLPLEQESDDNTFRAVFLVNELVEGETDE